MSTKSYAVDRCPSAAMCVCASVWWCSTRTVAARHIAAGAHNIAAMQHAHANTDV
jgi:hypothetical protein